MSGDDFKRLSRAASGVAIVLGVSALFGWIFDVAVLKSVLPGLVAMKVNTAVSFVLAGTSLWLQIERAPAARRGWPARLCALLALAVGLLTLTEYLLGVDMGIDQLLMRRPADVLHTSSPGRMAPNTALSFVLVGSALVLLEANSRALQWLRHTLSVAALFASLVSSVGYAFSTVAFYRIAGSTAMSIDTAFGLAALSIGILASRPRGRLLRFPDWPLRAKLGALLMIVSVAPLTFAAVVDIQAAAKKLAEMTGALLSARADQLLGEIGDCRDMYTVYALSQVRAVRSHQRHAFLRAACSRCRGNDSADARAVDAEPSPLASISGGCARHVEAASRCTRGVEPTSVDERCGHRGPNSACHTAWVRGVNTAGAGT